MATSRRISDSLARLAAAEQQFLTGQFLAPALRDGTVHVRLAGVICRLTIQPRDFEGFGVFHPVSLAEAKLVRPARLAERKYYLELFPLVRLILVDWEDRLWFAAPAHRGDRRFQIDGLVPVRFVDEGQRFEVIESRFDGRHFWYGGPDPNWDPARGAYLRQALEKETAPEEIDRPGLTPEERAAYSLSFQATAKARQRREEQRLRAALSHAGADFKDIRERDDVYTITFEIDGQRHVSVIARQDLGVHVAGICLSGQDEQFDLQSLVGVIREAQGEGAFVRVGRDNEGMEEDQYWQVHPPPRP